MKQGKMQARYRQGCRWPCMGMYPEGSGITAGAFSVSGLLLGVVDELLPDQVAIFPFGFTIQLPP